MSLQILAVDDSRTMRTMIQSTLQGAGITTHLAEDGVHGLSVLEGIEPDAIITDINMPRLDGFGLIEKLRTSALHADRPILVLTTESSDEKQQRARKAGATGWIVKPNDADKLTTALRRVTH